ncbi:MAG TPA: hypothetical protein VHA12_03715 [Candidatus Nanoarchaeia archaeon]|nr:hypothetical protein [Candidatus Nanoarchaeia archaeon]
MGPNWCSAADAKIFYYRCKYEEDYLGVEWVHGADTLPFVLNPEEVLSKVDYDFHNISREDLAVRASFILMPDSVRLRVREGHALLPPPENLSEEEKVRLASRELLRYNIEQRDWMLRGKKFLAEREHHDPDVNEFVRDYFANGSPVFYKIRDVMLHPERYVRRDVLPLSEVLHGGMGIQERLYGSPRLPDLEAQPPVAA